MPLLTLEEIHRIDKEIKNKVEYGFEILESGIYLIEIIASAKSWWQNLKEWKSFFNDDDLAVKINGIEFPKLTPLDSKHLTGLSGKRGLFDGEAAWKGNNLKGLKKIGIFVLNLRLGEHKIEFIADKNPCVESIRITKAKSENYIEYIPSDENKQAQDGNNRQWINLVFAGLPLKEISITAKAEKREKDSDDIKLIIDGEIQKNANSEYFKNWYWAGSLDDAVNAPDTEKEAWKEFKKELNLQTELHYIELWADRMPSLSKIKLILKKEDEGEYQGHLFGKVALYKDIIGTDYVNFRSEPLVNSENIIAEIKNGESVEIVEKEVKKEYVENLSDIWHKARWNGKEGYILSSFIEISGQERDVIVEKIKEKANEMELDKKLMIAIAFQESKFKPFAVSYTGVKGLFQITNDALTDVLKKTGYEVADRFDFKQSIEAGLRYYKYIILPCFDKNDKQYLEKTIAAYNAGYNKIPHSKNEKLVYKKLDITEVKKIEVEKYAKSILKNYQDKDWTKKLFIPILILAIFVALQLFGLNKINYAHNVAAVDSFSYQNNWGENGKNVIELYNFENNMDGKGFIDKIFKIELDKENTLKIKKNRDLIDGDIKKETKIFLNNKELLSSQEGLKDILLWKAHNILIARFWGGQTVYNYLFDLKNGGAIIPFVGDGETYNFAGSAGGSWLGEIPVFGEVFFLYYEGGGLCDGAGEIYQLYGNFDGLKMIKLWNMKESKDWCDNFKG